MNTQEIAHEILRQLGGNRFVVMTGAKHLNYGETENGMPYLAMALPRNHYFKVFLHPSDTYVLEYGKFSKRNMQFKKVVIEESDSVYCDMLQSEFTRMTGLYTYL